MGLTIDAIRNANLSALSQAADFWTTLSQRLNAAHDQFSQDVISALGASWDTSSFGAKAAHMALLDNGTQLNDAGIETTAIAMHLRNAANVFQQTQASILSLLHEADSAGLVVTQPNGGVLVSPKDMPLPGATVPPDQQTALSQAIAHAEQLQYQLVNALQAADQADQLAVSCLMNATGGDDTQFTADPGYDPTNDINTAVGLLKKPHLSKTDEQTLTAILDAHHGDELFANPFMAQIQPAQLEQLALDKGPDDQLTVDLAKTLAVASHSLSGNPQWMTNMDKAGTQDMMTFPGLTYGKGYVGLSYLIKDGGSFDSQFLVTTGDNMLAYEQMPGHSPKVWTGDVRNDPISNLMTALQNNPDAAQAFFHQTSNNPGADAQANQARLDYLLNKRTFGLLLGNPALKATGQALEVATTDGSTRTPQQLSILSDTVDVLAQRLNKDIPDDLQDSLTNMLVKNIPSVHMGLVNPVAPTSDLPPGVTGVAQFEPGALQNVLSGFGGQKDGATMRQLQGAETVFMIQELNASIPPGTGATASPDAKAAAQKMINHSATVISDFDQITGAGIIDRQKEADDAHNEKVASLQESLAPLVTGMVEPYQDGAYRETANYFVETTAKMYMVDNSQQAQQQATTQQAQSAVTLERILDDWYSKSGCPSLDVDVTHGNGLGG